MNRQHFPATGESIFPRKHDSNTHIHGEQFIQHSQPQLDVVHTCYDAKGGFEHLQTHVATSAFDSVQQVDAPNCHPRTRLAVLDDIMDWILPRARVKWILWLHGAAGAGKSAIARSIVALCLSKNIPVARFFFFRTDPTRNDIQPVVATLVHQLIQQIPDLLPIIIPKIQSDPLVFIKSLETQLKYLVFEPLKQIHREYPLTSVVVLLFDGIDECDGNENQTNLVHLIAHFLSNRETPIIAFFSSRAENQLQQVFRSHDVYTNTLQLALDNHYLPDKDIRLFLDDKFTEMKNTHPFSHLLIKDWPDPAHIKKIVDKSSGQFIYASVVINFLLSPHQNPAKQLDIIRGLRPVGNLTPFVQLDALYRYIFSQIQDIDGTCFILAFALFGSKWFSPRLEAFLSDIDDIPVLLADIPSIVVYKNGEIHFLHASLPDFLFDQARSLEYYLDKRLWCTRLSIRCFHCIAAGLINAFSALLFDFLPYAGGTAELRQHILALDFNLIRSYCDYTLGFYLTIIREIDFGDHGELYRSELDRLTRFILKHPHESDPGGIHELQANHNVSTILSQTESETVPEMKLRKANETDPERDSTALEAPHIRHESFEHAEATARSVSKTLAATQHIKAEGPDSAVFCDGKAAVTLVADADQAQSTKRTAAEDGLAQGGLLRALNWGRRSKTTVQSNQPTTEVVGSTGKLGKAKENSQLRLTTIASCLLGIVLLSSVIIIIR